MRNTVKSTSYTITFCYSQIKRMLVNQRGFIVESLKRMAASGVPSSEADCSNCRTSTATTATTATTTSRKGVNAGERDRTIGRGVAVQPEQVHQPNRMANGQPSNGQLPLTTCETNKVRITTGLIFGHLARGPTL